MSERIEVGVVIKGADTATQQINKVDKATKSLGTGIEGAATALDRMTGGAVTGFRKAAQGTKAFIKGLKLTRGAIIATGVGALVVAVVALVTAFTKTNKGAKMLKVAMAGLGAVVERVMGFFQAAGGFIVGLFTGGVTKAVDNYREGMDKLSGSIGEAVRQVMELERRSQALKTKQRDLTVQFAEGRAQIKEYNMIAEDTTRGLEERIEAAEKTMAIEKELMAARQAQAQEEFDIATQRAKFGDSSEEDLDNLAQLEINLINIRTESAEMQTTLNNRLNTIRAEAARKAKAEADAVKAAEKEKQDAIRETQKAMQKEEKEMIESFRDYLKTDEQLALDAFDAKAQQLMLSAMLAGESDLELRRKLAAERLAIQEKFEADRQAIIDAAEEERRQKQEAADAFLRESQQRNQQLIFASLQLINQGQAQNAERAAIIRRNDAMATAKTEEEILKIEKRFEAEKAKAQHKGAAQARKIAAVQILIEQGKALSAAIAGAAQAAAAGGPAAPALLAAYQAQMVGSVLTAFVGIKSLLNQAGAQMPELTESDVDGGGGGGGRDASQQSTQGGPQLALTPDLLQSFNDAMTSTAVQAYVIQQDIADADALAATLENQASLGGG